MGVGSLRAEKGQVIKDHETGNGTFSIHPPRTRDSARNYSFIIPPFLLCHSADDCLWDFLFCRDLLFSVGIWPRIMRLIKGNFGINSKKGSRDENN